MSTIASNSEAAILSRLIVPDRGGLSADAANFILQLKFDERDQARMHELATKRQDGDLSPEDEADLERYRHIAHLLELMQSKVRRSLAQTRRIDSPIQPETG
ncbi:MAG TPA: hypothetical protein VMV10_30465 [Pirellulales bacterium]|nr:hypothetical protein [Pirellulales bacterium]